MKVSKKILSVILSAAMVTGTVTPIFAFTDSKVTETTTMIVDDNFDNVNLPVEQSTSLKTIDGTNFSYRTNPYEAGLATVGVSDDGISGKSLNINYNNGTGDNAVIQVQPSENVSLETGDVIHMNFDTKYNFTGTGTYEASTVYLMLGDDRNALDADANSKVDQYFYPIGNSNLKAGKTTDGSYKGVLLTLNGTCVQPGCGLTDIAWSNKDYTRTRVNVDIVINTADEAQDGKQTIKQTYSYYNATGEVKATQVYYAIFDGYYNGDGDTTIDKITEFSGLRFFTKWVNDNVGTKFFVDNMKIEKVERNTLYCTTTTKNLIDCDFSDGVGFSSSNAEKKYLPVGNESNAYFGTSNLATENGSVESVLGPDGQTNVYAFKQSIDNKNSHAFGVLTLKNPNGTTRINDGDIIRFSYDLKHDMATELNGTSYFFGPMINSPRYNDSVTGDNSINGASNYGITESKDSIYLNKYDTNKGDDQHSKYRNGLLLQQQILIWPENSPIRTATRSMGITSETVEQGKWHHYEFIINTADKTQDGKQSLKVYIDKGTENEIVLYSDCDMNVLNNTVDKFTEFRTLEMAFFKYNLTTPTGTIYSTNYKLDVITPGFGVSGSAIENNDPTDGITLEPGKMTVKCALNVPGTDKKTTDSDYPKHSYTMYAAQYDGDLLVDVKPVKKEFSENEYSSEFEVDVKDGVDKLKLFAFDEKLTPLIVNETAVVNGPSSAHSISYTLANSDMH